jgi:DNA-binding protein H-NS
MPKGNLASMSIVALLKLRDDIGKVLTSKANEFKRQLARLEGETGYGNRGRHSSLKGRKVAVKYRDTSGNMWAGRGAHPIWLREKLEAGAKVEDFAVHKSVASRKVSPKKSKTPRRKKR